MVTELSLTGLLLPEVSCGVSGRSTGVPQKIQKLSPWGISCPHCLQFMVVSRLVPVWNMENVMCVEKKRAEGGHNVCGLSLRPVML